MKNFIEKGTNLRFTLSSAVKSGDLVIIGGLVTIATNDYAANTEGVYCTEGVYELAKTAGDTFTDGCKVYWDATNKKVTTTSTNNTFCGCYVGAGSTGALVKLAS
ncbi:MAG: DUF2190 family protein [bacterium]|nr:DUF2190 family protein [bacterium]